MTLSFFRARGHGAPAALRADRLAPLPTLHCRKLGALPPPLAGEGWGGGGTHALSFCVPPPCPSPASGGGDAGADQLPVVAPAAYPRRASRPWRALLCWRATITPLSPLSRMARIAIIALMLFAAAPVLAQQSDTTAPAPAAPAPSAPPAQTDTPPAAAPSDTTEAPPPAATPPSATTEAPPAAPPPPARAGNVDVRESLCLMIESAARAQNLPLEFFARVIWQESRFQPGVVGPRTRSGDRAQGIAQFMPRTAAERGLLDPFDPVQALPKSAEFLRELADQFGNLGLAAAAYNAGPGRLR